MPGPSGDLEEWQTQEVKRTLTSTICIPDSSTFGAHINIHSFL